MKVNVHGIFNCQCFKDKNIVVSSNRKHIDKILDFAETLQADNGEQMKFADVRMPGNHASVKACLERFQNNKSQQKNNWSKEHEAFLRGKG